MKSFLSLALFLLVLNVIYCSQPEEDPQSVVEGNEFVKKEHEEFIKDSLNKKKSVNPYFDNFLKHTKIIQDNNQELANDCNGIVNQMKALITSLEEHPDQPLDLEEVTAAAKAFYEKSYKNYYLFNHAMKWLNIRREFVKTGDLNTAMYASSLYLNTAQLHVQLMADTPLNEVDSIQLYVNYIKGLLEKEELDVEKVKEVNTNYTKKIITQGLKIFETINFSPEIYALKTNEAVEVIIKELKQKKELPILFRD